MTRTVALVALSLAVAAIAPATEIAWHTEDFDAILAKASADKKPVAIDFYAVWCGPCKQMDKETFTDSAVMKTAAGFVMARFDAEEGEGIDLAQRYFIGSFPTMVFLGPDGRELDRFTGFRAPTELLPFMELTLQGKSRLDEMVKSLADKPDDHELLAEIVDGYVIRLDEANAEKYLARLESADPKNEQGLYEQAALSRADLFRRKKDYVSAASALEALTKTAPKLEHEKSVLHDLGIYYARAGDPARSLTYFQQLIEKYPETGSYNAMAWEYSQRKINLAEAEDAGKKALEMSDGDPGIMDTLAEVYYAQGRFDDAIVLAKKELEKEPDDAYYQRQLVKYQEAKDGLTRQ